MKQQLCQSAQGQHACYAKNNVKTARRKAAPRTAAALKAKSTTDKSSAQRQSRHALLKVTGYGKAVR
ncbi:hypothetical protein [Oleidesulfovibrio sp.]|uniref:hypothetical protein n=1 Tax=Oleidesulfovibrio sp. TaxID=2909707 RepID=UPI003A866330